MSEFLELRDDLMKKYDIAAPTQGGWESLRNDDIIEDNIGSAFDGGVWSITKKQTKRRYDLYPEEEFSFDTTTGTFCCALPVFGTWDGEMTDKDAAVKLVKLALLVERRQGVVLASETAQRGTVFTNSVLKQAGFELVHKMPTKHRGEKYKVNLWMWKAKP